MSAPSDSRRTCTPLDERWMAAIGNIIDRDREKMIAFLKRLVSIDSGSLFKAGVDACGEIMRKSLDEAGFVTEVIEETSCGNHILSKRGGIGRGTLFLSGHLDTVCPEGTASLRPFRTEGNTAFGPGVGDMKGGLTQLVFALNALKELGADTPPTVVFLTGDEEIGSVRGRRHIEKAAKDAHWALVVEPSTSPRNMIVRRWGVGAMYLTIHGTQVHVMDPEKTGANACRELAFKILALESLTSAVRGVQVSVNRVQGGTARQVTAATAKADIDIRIRDAEMMEEISSLVVQTATSPSGPGISLLIDGGITRPPMIPAESTWELFQTVRALGNVIGLELQAAERTTGSDGCFTAAMGVPTLDGLGPACRDICGADERIEIASLFDRTKLLAAIIGGLARPS